MECQAIPEIDSMSRDGKVGEQGEQGEPAFPSMETGVHAIVRCKAEKQKGPQRVQNETRNSAQLHLPATSPISDILATQRMIWRFFCSPLCSHLQSLAVTLQSLRSPIAVTSPNSKFDAESRNKQAAAAALYGL